MRARGVFAVVLLLSCLSSVPARPQAPGDVTGLRFVDAHTLAWDALPGAAAYNVYRGSRADGADLRCVAFRSAQTTFDDPAAPPFATYVVAAWNADGDGPAGFTSAGDPRQPAVRCADGDGDGVADHLDNCPAVQNAAQADQDANGLGDVCDPRTYDFEADAVGQRPAGVTQELPFNASFTVRDFGGDRGVAYDVSDGGVSDRFDRLPTARPFQDLTVYVDAQDGVTEVLDLELWSEGSFGENAGSDLLFRIDPDGRGHVFTRRGQAYTDFGAFSLPSASGLRLRLAKGPGTTSTLHVDHWNGASWTPDLGVVALPDDHLLRGRGVALTSINPGKRGLLRLTAVPVPATAPLKLNQAFDGLASWKLFQRDAANVAAIPVPYEYTSGGPVRLEVALVATASGVPLPGFDFADHAWTLGPAPAGATGRVDLPAVPAGGNYDLQARLVDAATGTVLGQDGAANLAVGDVFLAAGQSNMSGYSGSLDGAEPPVDDVHLFGNDYVWKRAVEPMDDGTDQVDRVSEEAPAHTLMLSFAKTVSAAAGVPVAIVPAPLGGTNLYGQWQRDAVNPQHRGTLYGSSIHRVLALGYAAPIRGVIWYQGESDAGRGTAAYLADLRALVANYRNDLAAPNLFFGNVQLATYDQSDYATWLPIQEAQRQQALDPLAAVVPTIDQPRNDTIHLNVAGYRTVGGRLGRAVLAGSYGIPQVLTPRLVSTAFVTGRKDQVKITWDRDVTGGIVQLFRAYDRGVQINIVSMTVSGPTVTLQLQRAVGGETRVSYGFARTPAANWVRAADGSGPVLCFDRVLVN